MRRFLTAISAKLLGKPLALCDIGDLDGVGSAALFLRRHRDGVVVLMAPPDVKRWWVRRITWDFVADLPCPGKARIRADHHKSNAPCAEKEFYDPEAPASAALAIKALGLEDDPVARWIVDRAVETDTAKIVTEEARVLDAAIRVANYKEKLSIARLLAEGGPEALKSEIIRELANRGFEMERRVVDAANRIPVADNLVIISPRRIELFSYRRLAIELENRGARFVNIIVRRGFRTWRLYCGANKNSEYDCTDVARRFGGGGHKYAAGAIIKAPLLRPAKPVEELISLVNPSVVVRLGEDLSIEVLHMPRVEAAGKHL